jgi:hypothetical protein
MSFFSREQRYEILCAIKRGKLARHDSLTAEEEQYIQDFALLKVQEILSDPECQAAMDRLYESRWAHRFD